MLTFADLVTELVARQALTPSRAKDVKTSCRYLATALGYESLEVCPVDTAWESESGWAAALTTHFATLTSQGRIISAATARNTRNNLRVVMRAAATHGLLTAPLPLVLLTTPPRTAFVRAQQASTPYPRTYDATTGPRRCGIPFAQWPPQIRAGWQTYETAVGVRLRPTTLRCYRTCMSTYLGYFAQVGGGMPAWDGLFEVGHVHGFLRWQAVRTGRQTSVHGRLVVVMLATMAVVLAHPSQRALADLRNGLPTPAPLHTKRLHWVPLKALEAVADACLADGRTPYLNHGQAQHPGAKRASAFQRGVILKLLVRVPLRQRNIRELRLDKNLFREAGHWHLHFSGHELKIGERQGRANVYHVDLTDYCPDLIPVLEEFLTGYRTRLPGATTSPYCFLTQKGNPYTKQSLGEELRTAVAMRTGQRFYPHLIRTIWATEFLQATGDFTAAAVMLGDTVQMVMKNYFDIVHKDQHAKAKAFLATAL